ncbi:MAG TPA: SEC-C metal-binding domain-containing protein, partial [bacterium]|nr:SEC-C metal-binding domain-containing protein [bacterium]
NLKRMHNEELVDILFDEEDRVLRSVADEIIRRGAEIMPLLSEAVMDRTLWTADPPDWWAAVHATYCIGAIGGPDSIVPLMAALRWSDAYDNEWVTEDLPSILGSLGELAWPHILAAVADRAAGWSARSIAMDALGAQSLRFPAREEEAMALLGRILSDESEEYGARRSAAYVLLDFRRADFRKELVSFAHEERHRASQWQDYRAAFTPEEVERDLATPRAAMDIYLRDWLLFYEQEEIRRRQERWAREDGHARQDGSAQPERGKNANLTIGRDDPCPCGSGKPYRRCCWKKLH